MTITVPMLGLWMAMASLILGVIVMIFPKILNYLIGIYLIIIGVLASIQYFHKYDDLDNRVDASEGNNYEDSVLKSEELM